MSERISGTIIENDDGDFVFRSDAGTSYKIERRAEMEFESNKANPRLKNGLHLQADVRENPPTVEALVSMTTAKPQQSQPRSGQSSARTYVLRTTKGDFHNPYNFIPAPPFKPDAPAGGKGVGTQAIGLEQGLPAGHHRWHEERYSGRIDIEIKAITPLLMPDPHPRTEDNGHKIYSTLRDEKGHPIIPVTSLKGALRSAYEAITNSRMGVMDGEDRLAYREPTDAALKKIPCRIEEIRPDGTATLGLYHDPDNKGRFGMAWFPVDKKSPAEIVAAHRSHLQCAKAIIAPVRFDVKDSRSGSTKETMQIYSVLDFAFCNGGDKRRQPLRSFFKKPSLKSRGIEHHYTANGSPFAATGYLLASNVRNFPAHHDERLFFVKDDEASKKAFDDNKLHLSAAEFERLSDEWSNLIRNARSQHEKALQKDRPGPDSKHSRHLYDDPSERDGTKLKIGDMFYVTVRGTHAAGDRAIASMSPVLISRALYDKSPRDLLHPSLLPATSLDQLSPADRVFGWAHENGDGAFRGQARIAPVRFVSGEGIAAFAGALPLAILGQPKPSQWLFYGAADQTGKPLPPGTQGGAEGYKEGMGIRGRKAYPHQKAAAAASNYWDRTSALQNAQKPINATVDGENPPALQPMPDNAGSAGLYREFVRRQGKLTRIGKDGRITEQVEKPNADDQNRSISDWIGPGSTFQTSIDVINLSREEFGALLWLLDLNAAEAVNPRKRYHLKLGGGKPLGFGSAEVRIVDAQIFTGRAKARALAAFMGKPDVIDEMQRAALIADYRAWMARHYADGADFAGISFIKAFLQAATGHDDGLATHYPRLAGAPDPMGENFRWFMHNSRSRGTKETLGPLATDPGLHYPKT